MAIEKTVEQAIQTEAKSRVNNADFLRKQRLLAKMREKGLLIQQPYTIAPLDTIGRRRYRKEN